MSQHMMRYKVRPDAVASVEELLRELFAELEEVRPVGLSYAAFKLPDGLSFIHLVSHAKHEGRSQLSQIKALRALHDGVRTSCQEDPVRIELTAIGAYRTLAGAGALSR